MAVNKPSASLLRAANALSYVEGHIEAEDTVSVVISQRDLFNVVKRKSIVRYHVGDNVTGGFPIEVAAQTIERASPSGKLIAVAREVVVDGGKKQLIQVLSSNRIIHSIDLTSQADIYFDEYFANVAWSPDEAWIAVIVEPKAPSGAPKNFTLNQTFGETYGTKYRPTIALIDLTQQPPTVNVLAEVTQVGQVIFTNDSRHLLFTRISGPPRGLVYCFNRKSGVYLSDLHLTKIVPLIEGVGSARSLRLSPNGEQLVFLHNNITDPHNSISTIRLLSVGAPAALLDQGNVDSRDIGQFYVESLPRKCWLSPLNNEIANHIVFSATQRSEQVVVIAHVQTGHSIIFKHGDSFLPAHAFNVLYVKNDQILVACSAPNLLPALTMLRVRAIAPENGSEQLLISEHVLVKDEALPLTVSTIHLPDLPSAEAFLVSSSNNEDKEARSPLIVFPHGGPHSVTLMDFNYYGAAFALQGYHVLMVNYRGSTGFGEDSLRSLLGQIGQQDVEEVQAFVEQTLAQHADKIDGNRVVVFGGSHGGFLGAHLVSRYHDFYRAAALRNPVTDISTLFATSDIPDWAISEAGLSLNESLVPSPGLYQQLYDISPIAHVSKVKAAMLLLVGADDRRVPPSQSLSYSRALSTPPLIKIYPGEGHALAGIEAETDVFSTTADFFQMHLTKSV